MDYALWQTDDLIRLRHQLDDEGAEPEEIAQLGDEIARRERSTPRGALELAEQAVRFLSSPDGANLAEVEERVFALHESDMVAHLSEDDRIRLGESAVHAFAERVLEDDVLDDAERFAFWDLWSAFALDADVSPALRELADRLLIASANAGALVSIEEPHLIAHFDEHVHLEQPASLIRDVAVRELRGGTQGVSFRIAKGVSYRVGAVRARSVVVGTAKEVQDSGILAVTSQRVAYLGEQKTFEFQYSKLLSLDVYDDGIVFHVSNRQNAPMFRVRNGHLIAGVVNAAAQAALGLAQPRSEPLDRVPALDAITDEARARGHDFSHDELRERVRGTGVSSYEAAEYIGRRLAEGVNSPAVEPAADSKVCPDCAESVKAAARICRFCGYAFAPAA